MTPEKHRARALRARSGILLLEDVCAMFEVSDDTIRRWVKEGTFPPPVSKSRHLIWRHAQIETYLDQQLEQARLEAEREQARRDTKVQALYGGEPHGRRH